ncbi:MAG: ATP-binding cassette domain-containing protein, partial [Verrucomicrobiales bacterium]|nr:ATP-binding cassette domain-containing protein [Verrucomicrobiales bacterium]
GDRLEHKPSELSGGEQQRVAIARALINQPELVLADEPTGNLDSRTGEEIIALLASLRAERNVTLIVATHDAAVAAHAPRVVELVDGRIRAV